MDGADEWCSARWRTRWVLEQLASDMAYRFALSPPLAVLSLRPADHFAILITHLNKPSLRAHRVIRVSDRPRTMDMCDRVVCGASTMRITPRKTAGACPARARLSAFDVTTRLNRNASCCAASRACLTRSHPVGDTIQFHATRYGHVLHGNAKKAVSGNIECEDCNCADL